MISSSSGLSEFASKAKNGDKLKAFTRMFEDGSYVISFQNGKIEMQGLVNGSSLGNYQNGNMQFRFYNDGTKLEWHPNGQLSHLVTPDGASKRWDKFGNLIYNKPMN